MSEKRRVIICGSVDAYQDVETVLSLFQDNPLLKRDYAAYRPEDDNGSSLFDKGFNGDDILLFLLGDGYGPSMYGGKSLTEVIYECGNDAGIKCIVFLKSTDSATERQVRFLSTIPSHAVMARYRTTKDVERSVFATFGRFKFDKAKDYALGQTDALAKEVSAANGTSLNGQSAANLGSLLPLALPFPVLFCMGALSPCSIKQIEKTVSDFTNKVHKLIRETVDPDEAGKTFLFETTLNDIDLSLLTPLVEAENRLLAKVGHGPMSVLDFLIRHQWADAAGRIYDTAFYSFGKTGASASVQPKPVTPDESEHGGDSSRYEDETRQTAVTSRLPPCSARLERACHTIISGVNKALRGKFDVNFYRQPWFVTCLDFLCEAPNSEQTRSFTIADTMAMSGDLADMCYALCKTLETYHVLNRGVPDDDLPCFYRTIFTHLFTPNTILHKVNGRTERKTTFDQKFFFGFDAYRHLIYSNTAFNVLRAACQTECHLDAFKKMPISEDEAEQMEAVANGARGDPDTNGLGDATILSSLIATTTSYLNRFVAEPVDVQRHTILKTTEFLNDLVGRYLIIYCVPFSRYLELTSAEFSDNYDLMGLFNQKLALDEKFFNAVHEAANGAKNASAALKLWEETAATLRLRVEDPLTTLTIEEQEQFRWKISKLFSLLKDAASEVKKEDERRAKALSKEIPPLDQHAFRFDFTKDLRYIRDNQHQPPIYKTVTLYEEITAPAALNCIAALLEGAKSRKNEGWVPIPKWSRTGEYYNWRGAFPKKNAVLYRFKTQQIQPGTTKNGHRGEWRFYTNGDFDKLSPAGRYHKATVNQKRHR